jgi:hypothetical protein
VPVQHSASQRSPVENSGRSEYRESERFQIKSEQELDQTGNNLANCTSTEQQRPHALSRLNRDHIVIYGIRQILPGTEVSLGRLYGGMTEKKLYLL